jgi:hypothetical protein
VSGFDEVGTIVETEVWTRGVNWARSCIRRRSDII